MRQYALEVSRTLTECPDDQAFSTERTLTFKVKVTAEPQLVPGERYVVDYSALASWVKTSDFMIETHPSGTLKTINVSADDKTDQIVKSLVKTGFAFASIGLERSPSIEKSSVTPPTDRVVAVRCKTSTRQALTAVNEAEGALNQRVAALEDANDAVQRLALIGAVTTEQKKQLLDLLDKQRAQADKVERRGRPIPRRSIRYRRRRPDTGPSNSTSPWKRRFRLGSAKLSERSSANYSNPWPCQTPNRRDRVSASASTCGNASSLS